MKKLLLLIVGTFLLCTARTQITFAPLDQIISSCNTATVCQYNLDLNSDGVPDLSLINEATTTGIGYGIFFQSSNNSRVVSFAQSNLNMAQDLAQGTQVGPSSNLSSQNLVYILHESYTELLGKTSLYFGIEFYIEQMKHYGWIKLDVNPNYTLRLTEFGYDATADKPVAVGITNGTGIIQVNDIQISSLDNKQEISANGDSLELTATIMPEDSDNKEVAWAVSPPDLGIFEVDETNSNKTIFRPKKNGNGTIYAIATDGSDVRDDFAVFVSGQQSSNVLATGIDIFPVDNKAASIDIDNGTLSIAAEVMPSNTSNPKVSWSVSDESLAQITTDGLLTAIRNGTVTVVATTQDGSDLSDSLSIEITNQTELILAENVVITSQNGNNTITTQNGTLQLYGDVFPANANIRNVKWSLSDSSLADITYNGLLIAKANGILEVYTHTIDGSNLKDTFEIEISNQVDDFIFIGHLSIVADFDTRLAAVGQTIQYSAEILPKNATIQTVKWGIDVPDSIATINQNGVLTAKKPGMVTIFAYSLDRSNRIAFRTLTIEDASDIQTSNESILSENNTWQVYPNPVQNQFTVKSVSENIQAIHIYSTNGQLLESVYNMSPSKQIDYTLPNGFPNGVFYLMMESRKGIRSTHKMVKF